MSFEKETYGIIANLNNEVVIQLYKNYAKKLLRYTCNKYTINEDDAWAIIYKTIYKMAEVESKYQFENENKRQAFVFKTHINYLRNFFRDDRSFEKVNHEVELHENIIEQEKDTHSPKNLPLELLRSELEQLEDWQRILLLMRGQNVPYSDIAKYVDKPEDQLKVYYARLKKQLAHSINAKLQTLKSKEHVK
jgi:DNA-directed RNA polymerase specialized sigma24 family protein